MRPSLTFYCQVIFSQACMIFSKKTGRLGLKEQQRRQVTGLVLCWQHDCCLFSLWTQMNLSCCYSTTHTQLKQGCRQQLCFTVFCSFIEFFIYLLLFIFLLFLLFSIVIIISIIISTIIITIITICIYVISLCIFCRSKTYHYFISNQTFKKS